VLEGSEKLTPAVADVVANAMKDWAIEKGATHYCHWFQPMTGSTAEKHDSFISPTADGRTLMEFSGKELIQGEPDASSFPSGGLRVTFEARGYTAWDCTSPVFIKEDGTNITMYIPSAFCSYTGEALDKKTPMLRSMDALNKQGMRVLRALGDTTTSRVIGTLGAEQEYFLVDRKFYEKRLDLVLTARTLIGAPSPRGQEMDDHYFGSLHERIASYMNEINNELWKLGVAAKTQHNEVSPGQYELAPVFATVNVATDHNQLTMETMQKVAFRHGFVCLLHEKPFAGVNGSGKHNNWSVAGPDGKNWLTPGDNPHENAKFLAALAAVIKAVDTHAGLLRAAVATAGNDHRLGANEAPPAIISIFLGDQLMDVIEQIEKGEATRSKDAGTIVIGVSSLPELPRDATDRNRTSPFAFTGNKFEFRAVGSTQNCAGANVVLNTIVSWALDEMCTGLEAAVAGGEDFNVALEALIREIVKQHKRVLFNGDNYTEAWQQEASRRGLPNLRTTPEALEQLITDEAIELFSKYGVLTERELRSRYQVFTENYETSILIEAECAVTMARTMIIPAVVAYQELLVNTLNGLVAAGIGDLTANGALVKEVTKELNSMSAALQTLEKAIAAGATAEMIDAMGVLREAVDSLEGMVADDLWPLPTYAEMMFVQ
jgi:glutamine synthetase